MKEYYCSLEYTRKGQTTLIQGMGYVAVTLIVLWVLTATLLNPYIAGQKEIEKEAARLNALNIAGVLSFLNTRLDAVYKYTIDLEECTVQILENSVIVSTEDYTGIAYMLDNPIIEIKQTLIECAEEGPTEIVFTKDLISIKIERTEEDLNGNS